MYSNSAMVVILTVRHTPLERGECSFVESLSIGGGGGEGRIQPGAPCGAEGTSFVLGG